MLRLLGDNMKIMDFIRLLSLLLATLIQGIFFAKGVVLSIDQTHYISVTIILGISTLGCLASFIWDLIHIDFKEKKE